MVPYCVYLLSLFLMGALCYRIRGGAKITPWLPWGTQSARMFWCLPTAALVGYMTGSTIVGGVVLITSFLGLLIPHGRQMDMGRSNGTESEDAMHLLSIGATRLQLILIPATPSVMVSAMGIGLIGGVLHAFSYWLGWRLPVRDAWRRTKGALVDFETAWAELAWGGFQWVLVGVALPIPPFVG